MGSPGAWSGESAAEAAMPAAIACADAAQKAAGLTTAVPSPAPWSWDRGIPLVPRAPCLCLGPGSLPSPSLPRGDCQHIGM